ncbi:hypothetical protein BRADI_1g66258v3 [Brachypodium distachyon]|uniref:Uncharacterized protein n=1 Tax=Brachypodium distachyon TaxID=15368 RepID=A0A2K2DTN2_BRADI|nr:hypothetical protein BRADI_1g66258v3 [Brachypodium distachyon]
MIWVHFWRMVFILSYTLLLTARIAAGWFYTSINYCSLCCLKCFIVFLVVVWVIQEFTTFHVLKYVILFTGVMNSLFSV